MAKWASSSARLYGKPTVVSCNENGPPVGNEKRAQVGEVVTSTLRSTSNCSICHSSYKDPRLLPCLHSFCKSCLVQLRTRSHGNIKCPLCRNACVLPVDSLLPNTHLAEPTINPKCCGQCSQVQVVSYCVQCDEFLCDLCDGAHKRMSMFKSHKLVLPNQAASQRKLKPKCFKCTQHPKEALEVYCITCKTVICRDCALYSHNGHKFKPAEEAATEIKESLKHERQQLRQQLTTFQSHAQSVAKVEKHVTTYPDAMKAFITSHFDKLSQLLAQRKQTLLNEVDAQYNGFSKSLWTEKDTVAMNISSIEAGINFADQLIAETDRLEVSVLGTQALKTMNNIKALSWNPKTIENFGPLSYAPQSSSSSNKEALMETQSSSNTSSVIETQSTSSVIEIQSTSSVIEIQRSSSTSEEALMRSMGQIRNDRLQLQNKKIVLTAKGYTAKHKALSGHPKHSKNEYKFERNGTFHLEAKYGLSICTPLFPENFNVSVIVTVTLQASTHSHHLIPITSSLQEGNEMWDISFKTEESGTYNITAQLQMNGENLQEEKITITLKRSAVTPAERKPLHGFIHGVYTQPHYNHYHDYHDYDD